MIRLGATIELVGEFERFMGDLARRASDLRPLWLGRVRPRVLEAFERQFLTEGAHLGRPWAPLTPTTLKLRARPGHGRGGILSDTHRLRDAFTTPGAEHIERATQTDFEVGANVPYAASHQRGWLMTRMFGNPVAPREVPARVIVPDPMPVWFRDAVAADAADYLEHGVA